MASTEEIIVPANEWTELTGLLSYVAIQVQEQGQLLIHVADIEPVQESNVGLLIAHGRPGVPTSYAAGGFPETTRVFVKPKGGDDASAVVMTY